MKHLRVAINVAVTLAMMLPTGIFAECCCTSNNRSCCAVTSSAEVSKTSCCSCEQRLAEQDSFLECVTSKIENQDRSSCECCLKVRQSSSAVSIRLNNADLGHASLDHFAVDDGRPQQSRINRVETVPPEISNRKRQALLCVWIH
jgi:hypothetical protein